MQIPLRSIFVVEFNMKKILHIFVLSFFVFFLLPHSSNAESKEDTFDFLLALTRQDVEMDWWFSIPHQFTPTVSQISEVVTKEYFKILPIFNNYGTTPQKEVNVTYDLEIFKPDGSIYNSEKNIPGFQEKAPGPYLLPAKGMVIVSFEPNDPYGEYTIVITAYDHIKNQKVQKNQKIILEKFAIKKLPGKLEEWLFGYPTHPCPSYALSTFINSSRSYLDEKSHPLWSALWLYKIIYSENNFLIPHTIEFYNNKATKQQQKEIILLFHLLNKTSMLPIGSEYNEYIGNLNKISIPNPYEKLETGDQLDMLWAEFLATSRIKPIRQILTALNLGIYVGTIEKIKSGKLTKSDEVLKKAMLEAVFQSAVWSIMSNCKQSPLLFQYCVGLYESDQLNDTEKGYLGVMLKKVSQEKENTIQ